MQSLSGEECGDGLGVQAVEDPHSLANEAVAWSGEGSADALVPSARGLEGEVNVGRAWAGAGGV